VHWHGKNMLHTEHVRRVYCSILTPKACHTILDLCGKATIKGMLLKNFHIQVHKIIWQFGNNVKFAMQFGLHALNNTTSLKLEIMLKASINYNINSSNNKSFFLLQRCEK
jgi:hypothetical protein